MSSRRRRNKRGPVTNKVALRAGRDLLRPHVLRDLGNYSFTVKTVRRRLSSSRHARSTSGNGTGVVSI